MTQALTVPESGGEVITVEPTDAKAWELVHSVLNWMGEQSCYNYSEAFRQLEVAPASYYRAIKRQYVQGRILARMDALDKAMAKVLETHWPLVVMNMVRLAQGDGREAVQAARFLAQQKERIQEQGDDEELRERRERGDEITQSIQNLLAGKPLVFRKREAVVTEEVKLEPHAEKEGVVIDG